MNQEQAEKKLNSEPPLMYLIRGIRVEDGAFFTDVAAGFNREDISREAKKFIFFKLYKLEIDKNQNL